MSPKEKERLLSLVIIMALSLGLAGVVQAQSKTYIWDRLDMDIAVLENSDIRIVETQQFTYTSGRFSFGYREIPTGRLEGITDVEVWEGERQYQRGSGGDYTYETFYNDDGDFTVKWYYPGYRDSTHAYTIKYTVKGGLRFYEEGDQLFWKAVFPDRDVPVLASVVTVHLSAAFDPDQLVIAAYDGPRGERQDVQIQNKGSEVIFTAGRTQPDHELEMRVQFPHGVVQGAPPAWQAAHDRKADHIRIWGVDELVVTLFTEVSTEINEYGSGVNRVILAVDSSLYTPSMLDEMRSEAVAEGATVDDYSGRGRKGVMITYPFQSLEELPAVFQASDDITPDLFQIRAEKSGGLLSRRYSIEVQVDTVRFRDTDVEDIGFDASVLKTMDFGYSVTLPGKITAHNGNQSGDNRVTWDMNAASGDLYILTAESKLGTGIPVGLMLGICGAAVLIALGGSVALFVRRGKVRTTATQRQFCPQCGAANEVGAKFCVKCGSALPR